MAGEPDWVPPDVDTKRANVARVYDYWLGGSHNFLTDQDLARAIVAVEPNARAIARANRAFLGRAVRFLAAAGIRQFLDIGSGIPTEGNVHEVAQHADPRAHVVYADIDPVAVAHSKALLAANASAALRDALAPGSYLVLGHGTDESKPAVAHAAEAVYNRSVATDGPTRPLTCPPIPASSGAWSAWDGRLDALLTSRRAGSGHRRLESVGPRSDLHLQARAMHAGDGDAAGAGDRVSALRH
jgi:hypothetical protein